MEGEIALEFGMDDGEMLALGCVGRIDGLHTAIETENEIIQVEANAKAIGNGYLAVEIVKAEDTIGLVGIVANVPNVARIHEDGTCKFPEEARAVFYAEV